MILSVVHTCVMMACNRHHNTFQCGNLLVTVRHIEGHIGEISVRISKLT